MRTVTNLKAFCVATDKGSEFFLFFQQQSKKIPWNLA